MNTHEVRRGLPTACLALVVGIFASGCGGSSSQKAFPDSTGAGATAPAVTTVSPRPNVSNVPIDTKLITATFSEAMDPATLTLDSFTLACPTGTRQTGVVAYAANGNVATLSLTNALPASALCTVSIGSGVKSATGAALATPFEWNFTVDGTATDTTAPTITATIHTWGQTNIPTNTKVGVTFSEAMDPTTITGTNFSAQETISGVPVNGTVSYAGVNAIFLPAKQLTPYTQYTITVKGAAGGVRDVRGNVMAVDFVNSWTTGATSDTTAPRVVGTINANAATNVAINTTVGATFSETMNPLTLNSLTMTVWETVSGKPVAGTVSYAGLQALFTPLSNLAASMQYTVTLKGGAGGVTDLVGNAMASSSSWSWTTAAVADTIAPTLTLLVPGDLATNVATNRAFHANFSEAMDPLTITTASFSMAGVSGSTTYDATSKIATFTPFNNLATNTTYLLKLTTAARDMAGNSLAAGRTWSITTASNAVALPMVNLGTASNVGILSDRMKVSNSGTQTVVYGDIASPAKATMSVTGFRDITGTQYSQTAANAGTVDGTIYSCDALAPLPVVIGPALPPCTIALQAGQDARAAYLAMLSMPTSKVLGPDLANLSLAPGVYTSSSGAFTIAGGDLVLDARGDLNAIWVFQMAQSLTVGGPGATAPRSIVLIGGAQAKNIFWQVGSSATINAAGGGTMVGTLIAQSDVAISSAGNAAVVLLLGRVFSLGGSITMANSIIDVPAP